MTFDLREIEAGDGHQFERAVEDVLCSLGWTVDQGAGVGPDGGRDVVATAREILATGRSRSRRWVVQCKHTAHGGRAISARDLGPFGLVPEKHHAQGWLLVTSTRLTTDAIDTIEAARRAHPGYEFDYWDAEKLATLLARDECRGVLRQYLPQSYARSLSVLAPTRDDLLPLVSAVFERSPGLRPFFLPPQSDESRLVAYAVSKHLTVRGIAELVEDQELLDEFSRIWGSHCVRGDVPAALILLLVGLRRLSALRGKGLVEAAREWLLAYELVSTVDHRRLVRQYWDDLVVFEGAASEWTDVEVTSERAYVPPVPVSGIELIVYCRTDEGGGVGSLRVGGGKEIQFVASNLVESRVQILAPLHTPLRTPFTMAVRTDHGSDAVCVVITGFLDAEVGAWNRLV